MVTLNHERVVYTLLWCRLSKESVRDQVRYDLGIDFTSTIITTCVLMFRSSMKKNLVLTTNMVLRWILFRINL